VLAAPAYLERHGSPGSVEELARHRLLGFAEPASLNTWPLAHAGGEGWTIAPSVTASSGETVRHLALAGAGIASLSDFLSRADIASGALVPVLQEHALPWMQPVWAVFYKRGALAPRVMALVEFMAARLSGLCTAPVEKQ
jgi:DNA-binding transcriptional LysR family regulator